MDESDENIETLMCADPFEDRDSLLYNGHDDTGDTNFSRQPTYTLPNNSPIVIEDSDVVDTGETHFPHNTYTLLNKSPIVIEDSDVDDSLNDIHNSVSLLHSGHDDTGETHLPHNTYTLLNKSPILIHDDDSDDSLNDINNSRLIDVRNKLNMPIPEDQITVSEDSEDDSNSFLRIIGTFIKLNNNIMYGATENSYLLKRQKKNNSSNSKKSKIASTATVNLEHNDTISNKIPAGCSSLNSNASSSHRLESTVQKKQMSSSPRSVQLSSNSESLKQSNSLQLSRTSRRSQNLEILRAIEKPSNKYKELLSTKINYLIFQSVSSDEDDTSKKFISCIYENCGKLVEGPELLIDDLYCSLACKNQKQTVIEEEHFVDETSNPTEKTTVDRNHISTKLKNRINKNKRLLKTSCTEENDNSNEQPLIEDKDVSKYMTGFQLRSAPIQFFDKPFPTEKNLFVVGEKLEGIDPKYEALFCVMTVSEVYGYRIKLHFDGYGSEHDFWVNADCPDLFYAGWCEMNSRILQPPYNYGKVFDWTVYLRECQAVPAPKCNFVSNKNHNSCKIPHKFHIGGKLEALDKLTRTNTKQSIYVATVADILSNRVRIHFDGWTDEYDYWADITSTYIHPIRWCEKNGRTLLPPKYYKAKNRRKPFNWTEYLAETNSEPVPEDAFVRRPLRDFSNEMIIEVFDLVVPRLLRISKVVDIRGDELKIVYDGFDNDYAYWIEDDGPDIHPVGWSSKINHPIELPPASNTLWSCNIHGCKGYGNSSNHLKIDHVEIKDCPYEMNAWKNAVAVLSNVPDRLETHNIITTTTLTSLDELNYIIQQRSPA